jgi:hypothetical protein
MFFYAMFNKLNLDNRYTSHPFAQINCTHSSVPASVLGISSAR